MKVVISAIVLVALTAITVAAAAAQGGSLTATIYYAGPDLVRYHIISYLISYYVCHVMACPPSPIEHINRGKQTSKGRCCSKWLLICFVDHIIVIAI
jgi:hypothetical protein